MRCHQLLSAISILSYVMSAVNLLWMTLVALFCVLPRKTYAHVSKKFVKWFLILFVWSYERKKGYRTVMTGDQMPDKESALLIVNHPGQDWAPLYSVALRNGMLGYVTPIVKASLQMIPGFGWAMYMAGSLFLTRKWKQDQAYLKHMMERLRDDAVPFHIWLFPEGHRYTQKGYEDGVAFAQSRGMKPYKHLLVPRTKGFIQLKQNLNGVCDYVYDITVAYSGIQPTVTALMLPDDLSHERGPHVHVRRIPISTLPKDEDRDALDRWLKDLYYEKDALLHHFREHGRFPSSSPPRVLKSLALSDCVPALAVWGSIGAGLLAMAAKLAL